jgi:hypothetical protein
MTASIKTTTAPHPELLSMLGKRFPAESPAQLQERALKILELSDSLKEALTEFWATDR